MTTVIKTAPIRSGVDWKRFAIVGLCALTLLILLFTTQLNAVDRKTDEALSLTGLDFLLGNTAGKSAGVYFKHYASPFAASRLLPRNAMMKRTTMQMMTAVRPPGVVPSPLEARPKL